VIAYDPTRFTTARTTENTIAVLPRVTAAVVAH